MPRTLRLADGSYMRRPDVHHLIQLLYTMQCIQVIGFSNVGKSALLRLLAQPDVWTQELGEAGHGYLVVYIDCNRMLDMSDQGFYELMLRCVQETSPELAGQPFLAHVTLALSLGEAEATKIVRTLRADGINAEFWVNEVWVLTRRGGADAKLERTAVSLGPPQPTGLLSD